MRTTVFTGTAFGTIACIAAARADTVFFTVSNVVSPEAPSAVITAWAAFDEAQYAFAAGRFEVHVAEAEFSAPLVLLDGPGNFAGWISPDETEVTGIGVGQLHGFGGIFADTSNPIALWSVTWSTENFKPRTVDLWTTVPTRWDLYTSEDGSTGSFLDQASAGFGAITVVPAPPAGLWLVAGLAGRRRR